MSWREEGSCFDTEATFNDRFYVTKGKPVTPALAMCLECPSRKPCLEYALETKQPWGVWGGARARDRKEILKVRAAAAVRGESPKTE